MASLNKLPVKAPIPPIIAPTKAVNSINKIGLSVLISNIDILCERISRFSKLIQNESENHKINKERKPARNETQDFKGMKTATTKQLIDIVHHGKYIAAAKLINPINTNEIKNLILEYLLF